MKERRTKLRQVGELRKNITIETLTVHLRPKRSTAIDSALARLLAQRLSFLNCREGWKGGRGRDSREPRNTVGGLRERRKKTRNVGGTGEDEGGRERAKDGKMGRDCSPKEKMVLSTYLCT